MVCIGASLGTDPASPSNSYGPPAQPSSYGPPETPPPENPLNPKLNFITNKINTKKNLISNVYNTKRDFISNVYNTKRQLISNVYKTKQVWKIHKYSGIELKPVTSFNDNRGYAPIQSYQPAPAAIRFQAPLNTAVPFFGTKASDLYISGFGRVPADPKLPYISLPGKFKLLSSNKPGEPSGFSGASADVSSTSFNSPSHSFGGFSSSSSSSSGSSSSSAPSAPASSYEAPSNSYEAPSTSYGAPLSSYGVPSTSYEAPLTSYGAPSTSNKTPSTSYGAPSTSYGAPSTSYKAPSNSYVAPSSSYGAPSTSYEAPSSSYVAPSSSYVAPSSSYVAPSTSYEAPSSSYGAPSSSYVAPSSSYGAPSTSYEAPLTSYGAPSTSFVAPSSFLAAPSSSSFNSPQSFNTYQQDNSYQQEYVPQSSAQSALGNVINVPASAESGPQYYSFPSHSDYIAQQYRTGFGSDASFAGSEQVDEWQPVNLSHEDNAENEDISPSASEKKIKVQIPLINKTEPVELAKDIKQILDEEESTNKYPVELLKLNTLNRHTTETTTQASFENVKGSARSQEVTSRKPHVNLKSHPRVRPSILRTKETTTEHHDVSTAEQEVVHSRSEDSAGKKTFAW
ncbi:hypothetical protein WDU94_005049 [Cyamophila willieti]